MISHLRDQARMLGLHKLADQGGLIASAQEHFALLDAIESGKAELAALLMRKHLAHSRGIWAGHDEAYRLLALRRVIDTTSTQGWSINIGLRS